MILCVLPILYKLPRCLFTLIVFIIFCSWLKPGSFPVVSTDGGRFPAQMLPIKETQHFVAFSPGLTTQYFLAFSPGLTTQYFVAFSLPP